MLEEIQRKILVLPHQAPCKDHLSLARGCVLRGLEQVR